MDIECFARGRDWGGFQSPFVERTIFPASAGDLRSRKRGSAGVLQKKKDPINAVLLSIVG